MTALQFTMADVEKNPDILQKYWADAPEGNPEDCWIWTGPRNTYNYGRVSIEGIDYPAHRIAALLKYKEWPEVACHTCDNPLCVNPNHIYSGTKESNARDAADRGRRYDQRILTADIEDIRRMYHNEGKTQQEIADIYGVMKGVIWHKINDEQASRKSYGRTSQFTAEEKELVMAMYENENSVDEIASVFEVNPRRVRSILYKEFGTAKRIENNGC